jgi:hypothetical protein
VTLPSSILAAIEEALLTVDNDIHRRTANQQDYEDLDRMKSELIEMKSGHRKQASDSMSRIIVDSMDWEQPSLKKFNEVRELLRKHYGLKS